MGNDDSCEEKSNTLETVIKTGMDILLPLKSKKVPANESPWVNKKLKSLIHDCQSALSRGDTTNLHHLCNSVNRYRKSCQAKFYAAKVEHLRPATKSATACTPTRAHYLLLPSLLQSRIFLFLHIFLQLLHVLKYLPHVLLLMLLQLLLLHILKFLS